MFTDRTRTAAAIGCVAALAGTGVAVAQGGPTPTQITVEPGRTLTAGQKSPFDAPGVRAIRQGKAIPKGYVLVGQKVTVKRGTKSAGAALFFRCPDDKRLKTFGITGQAGFSAARDYVDHRQTYVMSLPPRRAAEESGTVYAVCR